MIPMQCFVPEHKAELDKAWNKDRCLLCMVDLYEAALAVYADSKNWKLATDELARLREFDERAWWKYRHHENNTFVGAQRGGFYIARWSLEQFRTAPPPRNERFSQGERRRKRKLKNGQYPVKNRKPPRLLE